MSAPIIPWAQQKTLEISPAQAALIVRGLAALADSEPPEELAPLVAQLAEMLGRDIAAIQEALDLLAHMDAWRRAGTWVGDVPDRAEALLARFAPPRPEPSVIHRFGRLAYRAAASIREAAWLVSTEGNGGTEADRVGERLRFALATLRYMAAEATGNEAEMLAPDLRYGVREAFT